MGFDFDACGGRRAIVDVPVVARKMLLRAQSLGSTLLTAVSGCHWGETVVSPAHSRSETSMWSGIELAACGVGWALQPASRRACA